MGQNCFIFMLCIGPEAMSSGSNKMLSPVGYIVLVNKRVWADIERTGTSKANNRMSGYHGNVISLR
ncbi:hypothetical protein Hanom_Chr11g01047391 [Helianthus anomalus]